MWGDIVNRFVLICAAAERAAANQLFVDMFNDEAQRDTMSVALNAAGDAAEPTHFACSIQLTDAQALWLKSAATKRGLHLRWRRTDALSDELIETTSGKARGVVRTVDALVALDEMGVKVRRVKDEVATVVDSGADSVEVVGTER